MEQLSVVVMQALVSVLSVVLMTAVNSFRKWLEARAGLAGVKTVEIVAKNAVNAVEQITMAQDIHGLKKFEQAYDIASEALSAKGIEVSVPELQMALEAAVKAMNDGWNG